MAAKMLEFDEEARRSLERGVTPSPLDVAADSSLPVTEVVAGLS